jgi:hypothetical protein
MMKWKGFGSKQSQFTRDKTLVFACVVVVGGEKQNQKVRIGGAAAKIRTGAQSHVQSLTTQPS